MCICMFACASAVHLFVSVSGKIIIRIHVYFIYPNVRGRYRSGMTEVEMMGR